MMMKSGRMRILGVVLCLALAMGSFPVPAYAETGLTLDGNAGTSGSDSLVVEEGSGSTGMPAVPPPPVNDGSGNDAGTSQGGPAAAPTSAAELESARANTKDFQTVVMPDNVLSGETGATSLKPTLIMSLGYTDFHGPAVDATKIKTIITMPKGVEALIQGSDMFDANQATDANTGITTITMSMKTLPEAGSGNGREYITFQTPKAGMVPDGTVYDIGVTWMYGDDVLIEPKTHSITVETSKFRWSGFRHSSTFGYITSSENQATGDFYASATTNFYMTNDFYSYAVGKAMTGSITIDEEFLVSDDVILTQEMLEENKTSSNYGTWTFTPLEYYNEGQANMSIKKFRATITYENPNLATPLDMSNISGGIPLTIKVKVNREKQDLLLKKGQQITLYDVVKTSSYSAAVKPAVKVKNGSTNNSVTEENGEQRQILAGNTSSSYMNGMRVYYTRPGQEEIIPDPLASAAGEKKVRFRVDINGNRTTEPSVPATYPGDQIIFRFSKFGNFSNINLDDFKISDPINQEEMTLIRYCTGTYTNYGSQNTHYTVRIYTKQDGKDEEEVIRHNYRFDRYSDNDYYYPGSTEGYYIELLGIKGNITGSPYKDKVINVSDISRIEFDYGTYQTPDDSINRANSLTPGFKLINDTWRSPAIGVLTKKSGKQNPPVGSNDPQPRNSNTAYLSYSYTEEDENGQPVKKTYPEDAEQTVDKEKFEWKRELTYYATDQVVNTSKKTGRKLRGVNPSEGIENGDLVEYTVQFSHKSVIYPDALYNPFVDDMYEGMVPYVTDDDNQLSNYAEKPFIAVASVTNIKGTDVTAARGLEYSSYHIGSDPGAGERDPALTSNTMRMRFTGTLYYGDTVSITYVMKITDAKKMKNSFTAWAYPPGGSGGPIQIGGGSYTGGSGGILAQVKPTITFTQTVTNPDGKVNSSSNKVDKDGEMKVKLVINNTAIAKNAGSVSLHGILSRFNVCSETSNADTFQDILQHLSEKAAYKYYKYGSDVPYSQGDMIRHSTASGFNVDGVWVDGIGYQLKEGPSPSSIVLNKGDWIEVEYTIKAIDWLDANKARAYERIWSYGTFGGKLAAYSYSNLSGFDDQTSNYDGNAKTQSFTGTYKEIYVAQEDLLYAGINRYPSTSLLSFNNNDTLPGRSLSFAIYDYSAAGKTLTVDKAFVRLPKYERYNGMSSTLYKGEPLPGLYGPAGDERQIVMVTRVNGQPLPKSSEIKMNTTMTEELRAELMKVKRPSSGTAYYEFNNTDFEVLIHTGEAAHTTQTYPVVQVKEDELSYWGGTDMGLSDAFCYKPRPMETSTTTNNGYIMGYRRYYPAPELKITTQQNLNNVWTDVANGASFATEAKIAWKLSVAPRNDSSYRKMLKETVLVLKVPMGVKYQGVRGENITVETLTTGGVDYLIIPLAAMNNTTATTFVLEGNTGLTYGSKAMEAYLFTNEEFYAASTGSSPDIANVITKTASNLPVNEIQAVNGTHDSVAKASSNITVSGMFAFVINKTVNKKTEDIMTKRGDSTLEYEIQLKNNSVVTEYTNVTFIDRLPDDKDHYVTYGSFRGSNTAVRLKTNHPVVKLNGTTLTEGEGKDYELFYANVSGSQQFVDQDFRLSEDGLRSDINWVAKNSWSDFKTANVFRINMISPMAKGATLTVSFTGTAPTDQMPNKNPQALNTFAAGFSASLGNAAFGIKPESNIARVKFPDSMPMTVEGTLFLDTNFNGYYDAGDELYQEKESEDSKKLRVELYNTQDEITPKQTVYPVNGKYTFDEITASGKYYAKLVNIPTGLLLHDQMPNEATGNRFYHSTLKTDLMELPDGNPTTIHHVKNASLVTDDFGTLEIFKNVTTIGNWFGGTKDKNQKFLFKIEVTPADSKQKKFVFYEVVHNKTTRTITGLPRGTYTVTEIDWATGYVQDGAMDYGKNGQTITYQNQKIRAECKNKKIGENFVHGIDSVNNTFKSNG